MADLKSTTIEDNYPDEDDPRHRCCCKKVHVTLGAKIMATLGIVLCFFAISLNVYILISANAILVNRPLTITFVVSVVIEIPATFLVFRALEKRREAFLIPVLIVQCLNMVRLLATFVMGVVDICQLTYVDKCDKEKTDLAEYLACQYAANNNWVVTCLGYILLMDRGAAFLFWSFFVYFRCYQFLKSKNQWTRWNQLTLRDSQVQPDSLEESPPPVYAKPYRRL